MDDLKKLPKVGTRQRIQLSNGMTRVGQILGYDSHEEMVYVRWIEYSKLPDEWITVQELQNG